jgi:hypothetical protein
MGIWKPARAVLEPAQAGFQPTIDSGAIGPPLKPGAGGFGNTRRHRVLRLPRNGIREGSQC